MASTPIEVYYDPGKTLTCDLYQQGSDTLAAGGITLTEATNRDGVYNATVVQSLTGYYTVHVIENSRTRAIYDIKLVNDTNKYYSQAVGSNVQNAVNALFTTVLSSINTVTDAIKVVTDKFLFSGDYVRAAVFGFTADVITRNAFDETTCFPLLSADSGSTQVMRTGADGDTGETLSGQIDGVSAKTDQMNFGVTNELDVNVESINTAAVNGDGTSGDKWRGA